MKIETVKLNRKFSLGNYEMLDVGFEASITEKENPLDILRDLEDLAESYLTARSMKPEGTQEKNVTHTKPIESESSTPQPLTPIQKELLEHQGWKREKHTDGTYGVGSLTYGWDFADRFSKEVIELLKQHDLTPVDDYLFGLAGEGRLVQVKKKAKTT